MAILTHPIDFHNNRLSHWQDIISKAKFNPTTQYISPDESCLSPELSLRARLSILLRTYDDDYHTDSFDIKRLSDQIRAGRERILFWGDDYSIGVLRSWIKHGYQPKDSEFDNLNLGTGTLLDVQDEFGEGYAEMCRTGSICKTVSAEGPILWDLINLLCESSQTHFACHHTFLSVPRNRTSTREIRGGAAIHRLHVRSIESSFWGIAPWYVMQGGYLEALDYRELYRRPIDILHAFDEVKLLYASSQVDATFLEMMMKLNLGDDIKLPPISILFNKLPTNIRWLVKGSSTPVLAPFNPIFIRPGATFPISTLEDAISNSEESACIAVFVPLEEISAVQFQDFLNGIGFSLTAMIPPKYLHCNQKSANSFNRRTPSYGIWVRPHSDLPVTKPYYLNQSGHIPLEDSIIRYLFEVCERW